MYHFLRPTFWVVVCYAAALAVASVYVAVRDHRPTTAGSSLHQVNQTLQSLKQPTPTLSPEGVVQIQLEALSHPSTSQGALQCMLFASPANRAATGPLERFSRLVTSPPYDALTQPKATLVGRAIYLDGEARVLVTLIQDHLPVSFVWVLSQQTDEPFAGCWMTDGVFPVEVVGSRPGQADEDSI